MKKRVAPIEKFEKRYHLPVAILVASAIILFWRGIWMLADEFLFPSLPWLSALIGLIIGLIILYARGFHLKELF
ncbi:hypothetical protein KY342_01840 [Candidatus Woesearchaeota archaeon]|nr:hypothetical protein [Candidatus Woesearchaeota archaeon]